MLQKGSASYKSDVKMITAALHLPIIIVRRHIPERCSAVHLVVLSEKPFVTAQPVFFQPCRATVATLPSFQSSEAGIVPSELGDYLEGVRIVPVESCVLISV